MIGEHALHSNFARYNLDKVYLDLLIDLHKHQERQGPGSEASTTMAMEMAKIGGKTGLQVADLGCGTGASTILLTQKLKAKVTAVDLLPEFLTVLKSKANQLELGNDIVTLSSSMDKLPFNQGQLDLIWSEGAIYNIGFNKGINYWRQFLKPGGFLVVSELIWTTGTRPAELEAHWKGEYAEIGTASEKIKRLEESGYSPVGYFTLSEECWLENYYMPLTNSHHSFLERNKANKQIAMDIIEADKQEAALYKKYSPYYSYGMFIAKN